MSLAPLLVLLCSLKASLSFSLQSYIESLITLPVSVTLSHTHTHTQVVKTSDSCSSQTPRTLLLLCVVFCKTHDQILQISSHLIHLCWDRYEKWTDTDQCWLTDGFHSWCLSYIDRYITKKKKKKHFQKCIVQTFFFSVMQENKMKCWFLFCFFETLRTNHRTFAFFWNIFLWSFYFS